jgi:hypothetical protein
MSFKKGTAERLKDGRHFTDMTQQDLDCLVHTLGLKVRDLWISHDVRSSREEELWVNAIGQKVA